MPSGARRGAAAGLGADVLVPMEESAVIEPRVAMTMSFS